MACYTAIIESVFLKCIGTNLNQSKEIINTAYAGLFDPDMGERFLSESAALFRHKYDGGKLPVKRGVHEILNFLKENDFHIALASSTYKAVVEKELADAGLLTYFEKVIGGDSVTISKPDPQIYLLACRQLGADPSDCYAIEDSYNGIRAAHAAGMHPVMVPDIIPADEEMMRLSDVICKDLYEVRDFLLKMQ